MASVPLDELRKVPYLNVDNLQGREVLLMPLWNGKEWNLYLDIRGTIRNIKLIDVVKIHYLASKPASSGDLFIPFVDTVWQRASLPGAVPYISSICDDFFNLSASLAKLQHTFATRHLIMGGDAGIFVSTELEYILILLRSIFDDLYKLIRYFWINCTNLHNHDAERKRKSRSIPDSLSRFIIQDDHIKSASDLENLHGIPNILAQAFIDQASFFIRLRQDRDDVVHRGKSFETIFITDKGFCVSHESQPFRKFYSQKDCSAYRFNENVVSLYPWLADAICSTIKACDDIMSAFSSVIQLPPSLAPNYKVFIRDPCGLFLKRIFEVKDGEYPWWDGADGDI